MRARIRLLTSLLLALITCIFLDGFITGCTSKPAELGRADNPIKFFFLPSVDAQLLEDASKAMKTYLEAHTPYKYKISIPNNYVAVVEGFGSSRADIASINTYGYLLAREKYGVEARLMTERFGERTYKAQYLARSTSGIHKLEDLQNKRIAFVDPSSISGYLMPMKYLKDHQIKPKETIFAMKHDNVVVMIYQGQVDAGVTFYSPPAENQIQDARRLVKTQFPDVEDKVKIIALSPPIPNDPIVFRKDMPENMKSAIVTQLILFAKTPEGQTVLKKLSSITGLVPATDQDYESTAQAVRELGQAAAAGSQ